MVVVVGSYFLGTWSFCMSGEGDEGARVETIVPLLFRGNLNIKASCSPQKALGGMAFQRLSP